MVAELRLADPLLELTLAVSLNLVFLEVNRKSFKVDAPIHVVGWGWSLST